MFSWQVFRYTSLDQSINFVLFVENKVRVLTKICTPECLRRILNSFSDLGNYLLICTVACWLCILSYHCSNCSLLQRERISNVLPENEVITLEMNDIAKAGLQQLSRL